MPVGQPGECVVRGPSIMSGYLDDDAANAEVFKGGWLHTGDLLHSRNVRRAGTTHQPPRALSSQPRRESRDESEYAKAGISGPFSRLLGSLGERRNGWLATQC
jgi:hypothetical protein